MSNLDYLRNEIQKCEIDLAGYYFRLKFAEDNNDQKTIRKIKEKIISLNSKLDNLIFQLLRRR